MLKISQQRKTTAFFLEILFRNLMQEKDVIGSVKLPRSTEVEVTEAPYFVKIRAVLFFPGDKKGIWRMLNVSHF